MNLLRGNGSHPGDWKTICSSHEEQNITKTRYWSKHIPMNGIDTQTSESAETLGPVIRSNSANEIWDPLARFFRHPAALLPALAFVTTVLYIGTLQFDFVWDDKAQIVDNPLLRSFSTLHKVFFSDLWYHTGRFQLYYRPLFVAWSMLNYAVAGLHPWGWHLGAILIHIAAVISVFWLSRKLGIEYWTAALVALIFALHPIHIECVAWISAVSDAMVTMFAALAFVAFLNAREPQSRHRYLWFIASCVLLACALLTKEIALTMFALMGLYAFLFPIGPNSQIARRIKLAVLTASPYFLITLGYLFLRKYALAHVTGDFDPHFGLADVFRTLPMVLVFYLRKLFLPVGLTGLYFTPYLKPQQIIEVMVPALVLVTFAALIVFWSYRKKDPVILFAALWMLIALAPALYLRSFGNGDFVRDRYIYLGSIGFAILLASAIRLLPGTANLKPSAVQGTAIAVICLAYCVVSIPQQAYWASDLLIYSRGHQLYPGNAYTTVGLAREYTHLGLYDKAIPLVNEAHRTNPGYVYVAYAVADVYISAGRREEGRSALVYAEEVMPEYTYAETGGAAVAAMWGKLGDYDRARQLCSRVLSQDPNLFSALYNCGNIQLLSHNYAAAEQLLGKAVQSSPELAGPRHFLGRALFEDGKNDDAQPYLRQAAAIDPLVWDYHYWLAMSLEKSGDRSEARAEYQRTLQLNAESKDAQLRLAKLETK
jgi:protein O-mannosyl-transferase